MIREGPGGVKLRLTRKCFRASSTGSAPWFCEGCVVHTGPRISSSTMYTAFFRGSSITSWSRTMLGWRNFFSSATGGIKRGRRRRRRRCA